MYKQVPNIVGDTEITKIHFSVFRKLITECGAVVGVIKQNKANVKADYMETQKERRF